LDESKDDMKLLIIEIERNKKAAKENLEKLNKIFNV
jgi:hypothetical protein